MASSAFFRAALQTEGDQLVRTFSTTLTFTVTYQAVTSLVKQNNRSSALLMVAVAAIVLVGVMINNKLSEIQGARALKTVVQTALQVATQFLSNLLAVAAGQIFFEVVNVWWIILFSAFAVLLIDVAASHMRGD